MVRRIRSRPGWAFFGELGRAAPGLSALWWCLLVARSLLPAVLAVAAGSLVGAVTDGDPLGRPLAAVGVTLVALQVLAPLHQTVSSILGDLTGCRLNDRLVDLCNRPEGLGHLEDARFTEDLTIARDFDLGITGPPLSMSMDFIVAGLIELFAGLASAAVLFGFAWWAPPVLAGGWLATHWLLKESGVWRDRNTPEVRAAQRHADYSYRLAVDPPAAKELRLFGLGGWAVERFADRRRHLHELQYRATRLRERSVAGALFVVLAANVVVFWFVADAATDGRQSMGATVVFLQAAIGASAIAFGGLSWALDGAAAPVAALGRLEAGLVADSDVAPGTAPATGLPRREIRFRSVRFGYPGGAGAVLDDFDLTIPAGTSMAIVGVNGAGKTTIAKLLCRLYDPDSGAIEVDGTDLRELDLEAWRTRLAVVFQDFVRYELPLRDNIAPHGAPTDVLLAALADAGGADLGGPGGLETVLARGYVGGIDLSGGQWQRVALARALAGVRMGAGVVLLDEPTAQLDVRGEAEIFERVLAATRHCTTILISHRFSTVRQADRICVVEHGRVVELGTHDELIDLGGRYRTMFELQASRFTEVDDQGQEIVHDTLA